MGVMVAGLYVCIASYGSATKRMIGMTQMFAGKVALVTGAGGGIATCLG